MKKLAIFDFDETLMDGETINILAKELGFEDKVAKITNKAMNGEMGMFKSLIDRVQLLKGLELKKVNEICRELPLMNGAKDIVSELKDRDYTVVCFSGGFRNATTPLIERIGIDADFSNLLHYEKGILTGLVGGDMMYSFSKGDMLKRLQNLLKIDKSNTLVVGDGANDISMFKYADIGVAFNAKPALKEVATNIIDKKDLRLILDIL